MVRFVQVILFSFIISCSYAQNSGNQAAAWKLLSFSGDISLNGQYNMNKSGSIANNNFKYGGGINLHTSSYVWHPNFLIINAGISYDPQLAQFFSTQLPNSFSNFNTANVYLNTSFFRSLKFNFDTFLAYNKSLSSTDKLYKVEIDQIRWGGSIHYDGSFKFDTTFEQINEKQNEPSQNREFVFNNSILKGTLRKSFSDNDENYFNYQFSSNSSEQVNVYENNNINMNIDFLNTTYFPASNRSSYFNTRIYYNNILQNESINNEFYGLTETMHVKLSNSLFLRGDLEFRQRKRPDEKINQLRFGSLLNHTIYESMVNTFSFRYDERRSVGQFSLKTLDGQINSNYSKKLPFIKGLLILNYSYHGIKQNNISESDILNIFDESNYLEDGVITFLESPNIIIETVVVKDLSGTLIYQDLIDYILIQRGGLVEIQRIIGGKIPNRSEVLVDYSTTLNQSYEYDSNTQIFRANLSFLSGLVNLNYFTSIRRFSSEQDLTFLNLNTFNNQRMSTIFNYKMIRAEIGYEEMTSEFNPFKVWNYSLSFNWLLSKNIPFSLNARVNDYIEYFEVGQKQKHVMLNSNMSYIIDYKTNLNFYLSYLEQTGDVQNVEVITGRTEFNKRINQLYLTLGINYYNRKFETYDQNYLGASIRLLRKF